MSKCPHGCPHVYPHSHPPTHTYTPPHPHLHALHILIQYYTYCHQKHCPWTPQNTIVYYRRTLYRHDHTVQNPSKADLFFFTLCLQTMPKLPCLTFLCIYIYTCTRFDHLCISGVYLHIKCTSIHV